jgi:N-acetylglucosaminyldiphosphoundecaprenol N-acetyl-beta-D-mannosaminyltransferase
LPCVMGRKTVTVLGAKLAPLSRPEVANHVEACLRERRRCFLITANVDQLMNLQSHDRLRAAYAAADVVVPDGVPLLWAARLLGHPLPGRVAGSDLIFDLCAICARGGYRIYLLGGRPGVAEAAAAEIKSRYPGAVMAGVGCPPPGFEQSSDRVRRIVADVRSARPDLLLVALGSPKQETFLAENWLELGVTVGLGVGIAFEFLSRTQRRAPVWMQMAGLEWSWRLSREPGRLWRRYLVRDPRFFWLLAKQRLSANQGAE